MQTMPSRSDVSINTSEHKRKIGAALARQFLAISVTANRSFTSAFKVREKDLK